MSYPELMKVYEAVHYDDHVVEFPGRFREITNPDGSIDHEPAEGLVLQQGTPLSAFYLNRMDWGIWTLFQELFGLKDKMINLEVIVSTLQGTVVNGMSSNVFFVEALDPEVTVIQGWIDETNRRVVVL